MLVLTAVGWLVVFAIAGWLNPYEPEPDGSTRRSGTHRQLGLPPCNFKYLTGKPCPACGMTTSFAWLAHGEFVNSLRANYAGTALALFGVLLVPWCLAGAWRGRYLFIRSGERALMVVMFAWLAVMLVRWAFVVLPGWFGSG
jgi:hypothetical protein